MNIHFNLFYPYNLDEKANIKEDNITRASLIAFDKLSYNSKIKFINSLLRKEVLAHRDGYEFSIELQENDFKDMLFSMNNNTKYLVGFCPSGKVNGLSNHDEIVDLIDCSPVDHESRPDGCLLVKYRNAYVLGVVFENKLCDLYPSQLKRHFQNYMNISKKEDIKHSFILYNYTDFFNLYSKNEGINNDLRDYLNISGHLYPNDYSELKNIKYNYRNNIEHLNYEVLNAIKKDSEIDYQKGWGPILRTSGIDNYINMIGLVYYESSGELLLSIRFAPTMRKAKAFYSSINKGVCQKLTKDFYTEIRAQLMRGYIEEGRIPFKNSAKFVEYFINNGGTVLHQYNKKDLITFLKKLCRYTGDTFPKNYGKSPKFNYKVTICPSLMYEKYWKVSSLPNKTKLITQIKKAIKECESIIGVKIHL